MPQISVVIVTYNYARYLAACVGSVAEQSYPPAEIIVVDDASTDETQDVVDALDHDVRYVRHQRNAGPARARNTGLRAATHQLVAFLDADDLMRPRTLSAKAVVHRAHPDVGLAFGNVRLIDEAGRALGTGNRSETSRLIGADEAFRRLLQSNPFYTSTVTLKTDLAEEVGAFDENMRHGEDWDLWLRMSTRSGVYYDATPLIDHRIHAFSLRRANFQEHADLEAMERMFRKAEERGDLARYGAAFDEVYWRNYFRMLHNKVGVLRARDVFRLYRRAVARSRPRRSPTRRDAELLLKVAAFGIVPPRVLRHVYAVRTRWKHRAPDDLREHAGGGVEDGRGA